MIKNRFKNGFSNPITMLFIGLILGIFCKIADIYTQNLGNIFSQMAIWILLGVLISVYSKTAKHAALNVFAFCIGMLATYYFAAFVFKAVYGKIFIIGWTVFAFSSPILGALAWKTKGNGAICKFISVSIVLVSFLSSIIMFDGPRVYDYIINAVLIYYLFFKRVER